MAEEIQRIAADGTWPIEREAAQVAGPCQVRLGSCYDGLIDVLTTDLPLSDNVSITAETRAGSRK